ncbi:MAG TPA: aspartate/glutamate racemase family protein [Aestuariivirgaceae bacterium]|nr:aspartate/glutamate racemase family protein [Aestuariivirgaceae bacterium]
MRKIDFVNPFGTVAYDEIIRDTLSHYAGEDTELHISHLQGCPPDIDYFYSKHLTEAVLFERIMQAEQQGFDAVIVGCCYDPGVRTARELVDIPVIGPMEASLQLANYYGHSWTILTDHHKAAPYIEDLAHTLGFGRNLRGVRTIEWFVKDMVNDPDAVARDTIEICRKVVRETGADTILMGCTIVAACYQRFLLNGGEPPEIAIVNPNLMALKMAELLADLKQKGGYQLSRAGYYEKPSGHYAREFDRARATFAKAHNLA